MVGKLLHLNTFTFVLLVKAYYRFCITFAVISFNSKRLSSIDRTVS